MDEIAERIDILERRVREIRERWSDVDDETAHRRPDDDGWTPAEILAHAAEFIPYWAGVAEELSKRSRPGLPFGRTHEDPARTAAVERHAADPLDVTLRRLDEALASAVAMLRGISGEALDRTGVHVRRGEMSVRRVIDSFLLEHLQEHAAQAERAKEAAT